MGNIKLVKFNTISLDEHIEIIKLKRSWESNEKDFVKVKIQMHEV